MRPCGGRADISDTADTRPAALGHVLQFGQATEHPDLPSRSDGPPRPQACIPAGQRAVMKTSPCRRLRNSLATSRRPAHQDVCLCIATPTANVRFCRMSSEFDRSLLTWRLRRPGTRSQSHSGETPDRPCLRVSRDRGARRVWERRCLSCIGDSGPRPAAGCASEHLGEPAFRKRVAGLDAELVRGYRRVIDSAGLTRLIVTLPSGGARRRPGGLTCGPPR